MSAFSFLNITFPSIFKKPETHLYPFEKAKPVSGLKGQIEICEADCILCGKCSKSCPCDAITVDKTAHTWSINHYMCVTCRSCIRSCPKTCLEMSPIAPDVVREKLVHTHNIPKREKPVKNATTDTSTGKSDTSSDNKPE